MKQSLLSILLAFICYTSNAQQLTTVKQKAPSCGINADFIRSCADSATISKLSTSYKNASRSSSITCGRFNVVFEDVILGNGIGFDDPTSGSDYQNCICNVVSYIQTVFNIPAGDGTPIDILFNQSWQWSVNPLPATMDISTIAVGGPLYSSPAFVSGTPGFYGGNIYDHMNTGTDPDPAAIDGQVTVNFDSPFHLCGTYDCNSFDFYSVMLHEIGHAMGWGSSLKENASLFPESIFGSNRYTMYDRYFLYYGNIQTGPMTHVVNATTPSAPFIDPALPVSALTTTMLWLDGTIRFDAVNHLNNPVWSRPDALTNSSAPNTISHLADHQTAWEEVTSQSPGFMPEYVMGPYFDFGQTRNTFSLQELRSWQKMGYSFNPSFLSSTSLHAPFTNAVMIANHSPFSIKPIYDFSWYYSGPYSMSELDINSYTPPEYTITNCGTVSINLSTDIRLKDAEGTDPKLIFPGSLFNIRGCGAGGNNHNGLAVSSSPSGDVITYTPRPDFIGRAQFGFNMYDGKEKGAFMMYTIDVTGCTPCVSNIIVNGNFEEGSEIMTDNHIASIGSGRNYYRNAYYNGAFGRYFPDGQPYTNNGAGIVRGSEGCYDTLNAFGHSYFAFDPGGAPSASVALYGDRYFRMNDFVDFFRLCSSPVNCTRYLLEFDYNTTYTFPVTFGFTNAPVPGTAMTLTSPVTVTIPTTAGSWQHMVLPMNYCSSLSNKFLTATLPGGFEYAFVDNMKLYVNPSPPSFSFTVSPDTTSTSAGVPVTLTASSSNPLCTTTYTWMPGGLTGASVSVSPFTTTTYTVTANDGCSSLAEHVYVSVIGTGIQNDVEAGNISIYPNPGSGLFFLDMNVLAKTELTIEVENILGQIVYYKALQSNLGKHSESIDIKNEADGIYFLKIKTAHTTVSKKIIKE